jgi:uncharacterized membrane protein YraQ (UPF0718 family)/copper chaperone CopZ
MSQILISIVRESWSVLGQMAPYLLLGFLAAGVLSVCISPEFVERHLGGRGFRPVWKATLFGVPLVLCSCGVIPVTASFRRHGASRAAATSFLLSTPQTGIDSIAITYALLGPVVAVFRPVIAFITGLFGGVLVWLFGEAEAAHANGGTPPHCEEACCTGDRRQNVVRRALEYGFLVLPRDIGGALLLGIVIAGVIGVLVPQHGWEAYLGGGSILSIVAMMLLGVPLYVCASASVPIAAGLIHAGASPGAALAFLISGPASNPATITTVWKLLGRRTTLLYLLAVATSAIGGGLMLDWLMPALNAVVPPLTTHVHETMQAGWLSAFWAILLLAVFVLSYVAKSGPKIEPVAEADGHDHSQPPQKRLDLVIDGMTCSHCAAAVSRALSHCHNVAAVQVDLAAGRAVVAGDGLQVDELVAAVASSGYQAHPVV